MAAIERSYDQPGLTGAVVEDFHELGGREDRNPIERLEREQVLVARDDIVRLTSDRACEDDKVILVSQMGREDGCGLDRVRNGPECSEHFGRRFTTLLESSLEPRIQQRMADLSQ